MRACLHPVHLRDSQTQSPSEKLKTRTAMRPATEAQSFRSRSGSGSGPACYKHDKWLRSRPALTLRLVPESPRLERH